ncbi:hypothetical protein Misp01_70520 [Microtetraspora sp. NBRC 13810]|nr:hypothetical protein Misp01_70520 [Microtetraspora sp. NBRC 13810]
MIFVANENRHAISPACRFQGDRTSDWLEAGDATLTAITSGLLVPSNYWRAAEVVAAVEARRLPEAGELREAYRELCAPSS